MAGGIIARLKANSVDGKVPVTGQDASVAGLQADPAGDQCMTVFKDTKLEAEAARSLAIGADQGSTPPRRRLVNGSVTRHRPQQGRHVRAPGAPGDHQDNIEEPFTAVTRRRRSLHRPVRGSLHEVRRQVIAVGDGWSAARRLLRAPASNMPGPRDQ